MEDPIVAEVRKVRAAYAARFKYDLRAMGEDLKRRTELSAKAGWTVATPASSGGVRSISRQRKAS